MIRDLIKNLPKCEIPKRYGWKDRDAIDLKDLGFNNVCDCLNKKYTRECEPFPQDFDAMLLYRILGGYLEHKWVHKIIRVNPSKIILGQRYIKRSRLLELLDEPNDEPIRAVQIGEYRIIHDGHHRLALKSLRKSKIYAKLKTYYYEEP
jgi:hypothetical protein